jgi:hypothetical protein
MRKDKWNPADPEHFEGKSLRDLQESLKNARDFVERRSEFAVGMHNVYMEELRRRIAEKIGK